MNCRHHLPTHGRVGIAAAHRMLSQPIPFEALDSEDNIIIGNMALDVGGRAPTATGRVGTEEDVEIYYELYENLCRDGSSRCAPVRCGIPGRGGAARARLGAPVASTRHMDVPHDGLP